MQLIRTLAVAGSLLLGVAASATAADLGGGMKDDVVSYSPLWQGRYMGVNIGASASGIDVAGVGKDDEADVTSSGFSGGVLIGYNFRNGPWVGGFEADINGVAADETKDVTGLGRVTLSSSANASLRVRGGYAWNSVFLYATGGLGITHYSVKSSLGGKEELIAGTPVLGLGAEFAIDQNWTMRAEALAYGGFGEDITLAGAKHDVDFGYSTVRVGLTRRFQSAAFNHRMPSGEVPPCSPGWTLNPAPKVDQPPQVWHSRRIAAHARPMTRFGVRKPISRIAT